MRKSIILCVCAACVMSLTFVRFAAGSDREEEEQAVANVIAFRKPNHRVACPLPDLIEGEQVSFSVEVRNLSDVEYRDLRARIGCKCVKIKGLEGKSLAAGKNVRFEVIVNPTYQVLRQEVGVLGVPADSPDGDATELVSLGISAKVKTPFQVNGALLVAGEGKGYRAKVSMVQNAAGMQLDLDRIEFVEDFLVVSSASKIGENRFTVNVRVSDPTSLPGSEFWARLRLPCTSSDGKVTRLYEERVHLSRDSLVGISPQLITLVKREDTLVGRLVVKDFRDTSVVEDVAGTGHYNSVLLYAKEDRFRVSTVRPKIQAKQLGSAPVYQLRVELPLELPLELPKATSLILAFDVSAKGNRDSRSLDGLSREELPTNWSFVVLKVSGE